MQVIDYLPGFYHNSPEVQAIQQALEPEAQRLRQETEQIARQLALDTAEWGLDYWERALGIPVDVSKPLEFRRSRAASKLRGQGTATVALLQNVAQSFANGQVDILEYPSEYRFEVKFTGVIGIPPNMEDLSDAIEEIKPAHLTYSYIILYRLHKNLKTYTHAGLGGYSHRAIREEKLT